MTRFTISDFLTTKNFSFGTPLTTGDIISSLILTIIISLFIYLIYKKTYSGPLYSKEFNVTLIVVSTVVAAIMMGISSNLALSLGMIGALSIVRFRTAIKDPRDITFLFWSISVGIINGAQFYKLSIISSLFIGFTLILLSKKIQIGQPHILVLKYSGLDHPEISRIIKKNCTKSKIRNTTVTDKITERVIEIKLKRNHEFGLLNDLKAIKNINSINLFSYSGELSD